MAVRAMAERFVPVGRSGPVQYMAEVVAAKALLETDLLVHVKQNFDHPLLLLPPTTLKAAYVGCDLSRRQGRPEDVCTAKYSHG